MKIIGLTFFIIASGLLTACGPSTLDKEKLMKVKIGDSVFMKSPGDRKAFISVGNIKRVPILGQDELRRINYSRKDTIGFESDSFYANDAEECFYKSGSTFIGTCIGKDSVQTEYDGKYFIKIQPSKCLQQLVGKSVVMKPQKTYFVKVDDIFLENQLQTK